MGRNAPQKVPSEGRPMSLSGGSEAWWCCLGMTIAWTIFNGTRKAILPWNCARMQPGAKIIEDRNFSIPTSNKQSLRRSQKSRIQLPSYVIRCHKCHKDHKYVYIYIIKIVKIIKILRVACRRLWEMGLWMVMSCDMLWSMCCYGRQIVDTELSLWRLTENESMTLTREAATLAVNAPLASS